MGSKTPVARLPLPDEQSTSKDFDRPSSRDSSATNVLLTRIADALQVPTSALYSSQAEINLAGSLRHR